MKEVRDFIGQILLEGDWIVYPQRWGSSLSMIGPAEIVKIDKKCVKIQVKAPRTNWDGSFHSVKKSTITCINRCVKVNISDAVDFIDKIENTFTAGFTVPGWYFWDESATNCYGPYETAGEANEHYHNYTFKKYELRTTYR